MVKYIASLSKTIGKKILVFGFALFMIQLAISCIYFALTILGVTHDFQIRPFLAAEFISGAFIIIGSFLYYVIPVL